MGQESPPSVHNPGANDYDKLSQVTGMLRQAREAGVVEAVDALSTAQERIKQRLNEAKPPH
eukprot:3398446-Alexandrium_andersonii.AAC.1